MKTISIDACGMQCPGPVMQLKKHYDRINEGERIEIKVTDMAFGEDLSSWCRMVGANIIRMENSGGVITACIEKGEKKPENARSETMNNSSTLIVFDDNLDKALASFVIANGAASTGKKVSIFFTFWGLNVIKKIKKPAVKKDFMGGMFGMWLPSGSRKLS